MRQIVNSVCAAYDANTEGDCRRRKGRVGFSEDFAKKLQQKPGAYILMGNGVVGPHHAQTLHNPNYDFNIAQPRSGRNRN